jgi:nucleoside-diphosphate kinase
MQSCVKLVFLSVISLLVSTLDNNREMILIIIKPDGMRRNLRLPIYEFLESTLDIHQLRERIIPQASPEVLKDHYTEHVGRAFYNELLKFMRSGPIAVSVWSGPVGTVDAVRLVVGVTDPQVANEGTIRRLYGESKQMNVVHASDSVSSAKREVLLWFGET